MITLRALVGLPVILKGRRAGQVEGAYLAPGGEKLLGLSVRCAFRGVRWLPGDGISSLGGVCVISAQSLERLPRQLPPMPGPVWDTSGLRLGQVADVYLEGLRTLALAVTLGPVDDRRFGRMAVRTFTLLPLEDCCRVVTSLNDLEPLSSFLKKEGSHGPG